VLPGTYSNVVTQVRADVVEGSASEHDLVVSAYRAAADKIRL
jgi:hypothetical protein